jgi:hypothetical protein
MSKDQFIPKENLPIPRILLLDFEDDELKDHLTEAGYTVSAGFSGFANTPFFIPEHHSELEIILWNTKNIRTDNQITTGNGDFDLSTTVGRDMIKRVFDILERYFERIRDKEGFVGIFLGDTIPSQVFDRLPRALNSEFDFGSRRTTTLTLKKNDKDPWSVFFGKFIREQDIKFFINWEDNLVNFINYFEDEDEHIHAVAYRHFAIIPKIDNEKEIEAVTAMLQEVLPLEYPKIFPLQYYFLWANTDKYQTSELTKLLVEKEQIVQEYKVQFQAVTERIELEKVNSSHLNSLLISDDSSLFSEGNKLSNHVHKVLEEELQFKVTNVDELRLNVGASLKEDKWIEDEADNYFALVEVKGTEKGAKANWIRQDLNAHIREFEVVKGVTGLKSVLIFNHDRRTEPTERSEPFKGDNELITFCEKSNICLMPVYELYKLVMDIRKQVLAAEAARQLIKNCSGLFKYG